jgi:uncharacterized membrane protein
MSTRPPISSRPELRVVSAVAAAAVFIVAWAALDHGFYRDGRIIDTPVYSQYGHAVRDGEVPYRDFAVEYPPGALVAFVPPAFVDDYDRAFKRLMEMCGIALVLLAALGRARPWGVAFVAISPLLIGSLVLSRFDLLPAALTAGAIAALLRDRHRLGWAVLAAAFVVKLYAGVLVPLAVLWTLRRAGRRELVRAAAGAAAIVAAVVVPFLVVAPRGLWDSVSGQLSRPLQIESLAASVLTTFGTPTVVQGHGSQNLAGHGTVAALTSAASVLVLAALWVAFARRPAEPQRLVRYSAACVCAFVAFGKVLSPQYLVWLVPLVPLVRGRRGLAATAILGAALVTTQTWFPQRYWDYAERFDNAWVVLARNLLLVALVVVLAVSPPALERVRSSSRDRPDRTRRRLPRFARRRSPAPGAPASR